MLNNFIYAQTKDLFLEKLNAGEILDEAIVFIEDTKEIWNHGTYFGRGSGGSEIDSELLSEIQTAVAQLQSDKADKSALADYALKSELPSLDGYLTKTAADDLYATIAQYNTLNQTVGNIQTELSNKLTSEDLEGYAKSEDVPTKLSDLTDDSDFITNTEATAAYAPKSLVETVDNQATTISTLATKSELSTGLAGKLDNSAASGFVPTTRKINGVALDKDITITATDPNAATKTELNSVNTDLQTFKSNVATTYATDQDVANAVSALVDSSPDTLNTLNELAAALGDDPNFATTVATNIGKKADKTELSDLQTNLNNLHSVARTGNYWSLKNIPNVNMRGVDDGDPKNKTHYVYLEDEIVGNLGSIYFDEEEYRVDDFSETLPREEQPGYCYGEVHYSYEYFDFNPKETKIIVEILNNDDDENVSKPYGSCKVLAFDLEDQDVDLRPYLVPNSYITDDGPVTFKLICLNELHADDFDGYSKELTCYLIVNNYALNRDYIDEFNGGMSPRVRIGFGKIKELDDCFIPDNIVRKSDLIENQGEFDEKVFEGDLNPVSDFLFNTNDYTDALLDVDLHYYIDDITIKHLKQSFVAPKLLEDEWALLYEDTDEILENSFGGPFSIMYNSPASYPDESCFSIDHPGARVWGKATIRLVKSYKTFDEKYLPDLSDKYISSSLLGENTLLHSGNVGDYACRAININYGITDTDNAYEGGKLSAWSNWGNITNNPLASDYASGLTISYSGNAFQIAKDAFELNKLYVRMSNYRSDAIPSWSDWKTIAFTDSNVATATYAFNARTLVDAQGGKSVAYVSGNIFYIGDSIYPTISTHILGNYVRLRYGANASTGLILNSSGNVTIGSSDLAGGDSRLYVDGTLSIPQEKGIYMVNASGTLLQSMYLASNGNINVGRGVAANGGSLVLDGASIFMRYGTGGATALYITSSGNVGIGTTDPQYKLHVSGSFNATSGYIGGNTILHSGNVGSYAITSHQDISGKVDKVSGKGLSTNDFTTTLKNKLEALPTTFAPTNAEANVQADWNVSDSTSDAFIKNKPTIPTVPNLSGGSAAETGKYVSGVTVSGHTVTVTKGTLPTIPSKFTGTSATTSGNSGTNFSAAPGGHTHSVTASGSVSSSFSGTAATSGQNSGTNFSAAPGGHTHSVTAGGSVSSSFTGSAVTSGANSGTNFSAAPGGHTHSVTASGTISLVGVAVLGILQLGATFSGSEVTSGANSGTNTSVSPASHTHSVTAAGSVSSSFTGSAVTSGANSGTNTSVAPAKHTHSVTATGSVSSSFTGSAVTSGANSGTNGSVAPGGHTHTVTATGSIS